MNKYTIYFEMFGRKMKTTVEGLDESDAKESLERKIIYHKIVLTEDNDAKDECEDIQENPFANDPTVRNLMDVLGMTDKKKKKRYDKY